MSFANGPILSLMDEKMVFKYGVVPVNTKGTTKLKKLVKNILQPMVRGIEKNAEKSYVRSTKSM